MEVVGDTGSGKFEHHPAGRGWVYAWTAAESSGRFSSSRATTGVSNSPAACWKGAVANLPSTIVHGVRSIAELNPTEDMGDSDPVPHDDTAVGGAGNRVRDKRDPELGIADRVSGNSRPGGSEDQNARGCIRGVGDGVGRPDIIHSNVGTDFPGGSEANLDRILGGAIGEALANHGVSGDGDRRAHLIPRDSVLLIVLNVTV